MQPESQVDSTTFEAMVKHAIDNIPPQYGDHIKNVAFVVEDLPSEAQRQKLHLVDGVTLFGLYEGVPLTKRSSGYNLVLPDKITLFRLPILSTSQTIHDVQRQIDKTVWHEVAHYFGLDHYKIKEIESKNIKGRS
ncbi:MAG TPA: metallopeptidase family protein [Candidatus Saccharibacteria bacterium]|nr:metallopeptidase family protein [Candidatus Saccharibacteria bacterium]